MASGQNSGEAIARACHEANKGWCEAHGDFTQKTWDEAQQWQRDSAIRGVAFVLENPDANPEDTHNAWLEDKLANGWTYGETKDEVAKTHPSLRPYDELSPAERDKDTLFRAIVKALA